MIPAAVKLFECDAIRNRWRGVSFFAGSEIGMAERIFSEDLAAMRDCDDAAGLL
jgi:hypothetical protein